MNQDRLKALLVEDNPGDQRLIRFSLQEAQDVDVEVAMAASIREAEEWLSAEGCDVILLDLSLPDGRGMETVVRVRAAADEIPIVVLTGQDDTEVGLRAVKAGAQDYLVKGSVNTDGLIRAIRYAVERRGHERAEFERRGLAEALKAMERVLGVVGHELRTPLAAMRLLAEFLLSERCPDPAEQQKMLRSLHGEVVRMTDTVNQVLEAARLNSGVAQWNWGAVSIARACAEAAELFQPLIDPSSVSLRVQVSPPDLRMRGDQNAMRRLIINLVSNAVKHTRRGAIDIVATPIIHEGAGGVRIDIKDTGAGMTDEVIARLGTAFALNTGVVGTATQGGTGLGLAICKSIVAAHGGAIAVNSTRGRGTTFSVLLRGDLRAPTESKHNAPIISLASLDAA